MAEDRRRGGRPSQGGGRGDRPSGPRGSSAGQGSGSGRRSGGAGRPGASSGKGGPGAPGSKGAAGGKGGAAGQGGQRGGFRSDRAERGSERPDRGERRGRPDSRGGRPEQKGGRPQRFDRSERAPREERTTDQKAYDGPELPEHITGKELDRNISVQLRGLPEKLAARIARHMVAAGELIDSDPELAYQHAKAAKSRAQRIAVIREALGEAAYAAGHYAEALAELRAAKRMNGATAYLPIMADCHRALGQPEQAIKLAQSPSVRNFIPEAKAEMTIVEAGARRDLGQLDAALRTLEHAPLMSKSRAPWVVRLRYAYADTLEAAGRHADALTWFHRTFAIDSEELTDASARAAALEKRIDEG